MEGNYYLCIKKYLNNNGTILRINSFFKHLSFLYNCKRQNSLNIDFEKEFDNIFTNYFTNSASSYNGKSTLLVLTGLFGSGKTYFLKNLRGCLFEHNNSKYKLNFFPIEANYKNIRIRDYDDFNKEISIEFQNDYDKTKSFNIIEWLSYKMSYDYLKFTMFDYFICQVACLYIQYEIFSFFILNSNKEGIYFYEQVPLCFNLFNSDFSHSIPFKKDQTEMILLNKVYQKIYRQCFDSKQVECIFLLNNDNLDTERAIKHNILFDKVKANINNELACFTNHIISNIANNKLDNYTNKLYMTSKNLCIMPSNILDKFKGIVYSNNYSVRDKILTFLCFNDDEYYVYSKIGIRVFYDEDMKLNFLRDQKFWKYYTDKVSGYDKVLINYSKTSLLNMIRHYKYRISDEPSESKIFNLTINYIENSTLQDLEFRKICSVFFQSVKISDLNLKNLKIFTILAASNEIQDKYFNFLCNCDQDVNFHIKKIGHSMKALQSFAKNSLSNINLSIEKCNTTDDLLLILLEKEKNEKLILKGFKIYLVSWIYSLLVSIFNLKLYDEKYNIEIVVMMKNSIAKICNDFLKKDFSSDFKYIVSLWENELINNLSFKYILVDYQFRRDKNEAKVNERRKNFEQIKRFLLDFDEYFILYNDNFDFYLLNE